MQADPGLERAFRKVRLILEGDERTPGLTRQDLERMVGYPERGQGPLSYTLPPQEGLEGVRAVRFFYYPKDPEVTLIIEVEDQQGRRHLRHLKWNGLAWISPPSGLKSELVPTREVLPEGYIEIGGDYYVGFSSEEAHELAERVYLGEAGGQKYLLCPQDSTRIFYGPSVAPAGLICPICGNTSLLFKAIPIEVSRRAQEEQQASEGKIEAKLEALVEQNRELSEQLSELIRLLKRNLG